MKFEIRNLKSERSSKPEAGIIGAFPRGAFNKHLNDVRLVSDFGFRISFELRQFGIRTSS